MNYVYFLLFSILMFCFPLILLWFLQKCKSEDDCNEGQCCLKYRSTYRYGKCSAYLQEGAKCYKVGAIYLS
jgi:hypothetical protein